MRHNQKSQPEKKSCLGSDQSQRVCCTADGQTQPMLQQVLPEAIAIPRVALPLPDLTQEITASDSKSTLVRFTSPPEPPSPVSLALTCSRNAKSNEKKRGSHVEIWLAIFCTCTCMADVCIRTVCGSGTAIRTFRDD